MTDVILHALVNLMTGWHLFYMMVGVIVGLVDLLTRQRDQKLSLSLGEANRRLREQALKDPLTGLPNRAYFDHRLKALSRAQDGKATPLAVMMVDLDGFKAINDSFGHPTGDLVLKEMARRLRAEVGPGNLVARVGGDEFLVLCRRSPADAGGTPSALAQRILHSLSRSFTLPHAVEVKLSCSIGLVHSPEFGPPQRLLACADAAMYAAKRQGGSTFAVFEPRMEHDSREELALQTELRQALARNELVLYYQPKMDARSGLITGVEALVRWHHPVRGLVMPGVFIPVAERFGLIGQLGDWVIKEACRQLAVWRASAAFSVALWPRRFRLSCTRLKRWASASSRPCRRRRPRPGLRRRPWSSTRPRSKARRTG